MPLLRSFLALLAFSAVFLSASADAFGTLQSVAVQGILTCNGKPSVGTKVKLYEKDTVDPDDLLDEKVTDEEGHFELAGSETETGKIEPKLNIYHHCNEEDSYNPLKNFNRCFKKLSIRIPNAFISEGSVAKKTYDAGTINLAGRTAGETRDCLN